jgi:hypothetical protein
MSDVGDTADFVLQHGLAGMFTWGVR